MGVFGIISLAAMVAFVWHRMIEPVKSTGWLSLHGSLIIGGIVSLVGDASLSTRQYLLTWNCDNVDRGGWARYLRFRNSEASARCAESLIWGPAMCIYFCAGVAIAACHVASRVRRRCPTITKFRLSALVFAFEFILYFIVESLVIRTSCAYASAKMYAPLTAGNGVVHQFPAPESVTGGVCRLHVHVGADGSEGTGLYKQRCNSESRSGT